MKIDTIILAAGKGTRMNSALPKVLHPIAGKPMLGHVIETACRLEDNRLHVVIGHEAEQVVAAFDDASINWVHQTEQLGTGHAVMQALPHIADDALVLVLYGDVPLIRLETVSALLDQLHQPNSMALLTVCLDNPKGYGRIIRDGSGDVCKIVEQKDASPQELDVCEVNTGILAAYSKDLKSWLNKTGNDNAQKEYYLTDIIALAREEGFQVNTFITEDSDEVLGVNDRLQQAHLEQCWQRNHTRELMKQGVSFANPDSFICRGSLSAGQDVFIDSNVIVEGEVTLGNNVQVGSNCVVINSRLADGARVKPFTHIEGAEIGSACELGPYARIRPGTVLSSEVKIGNFVETKKALIANGSKVNHLSYIGDASIGENCNIGAGTITCNYDGISKYKTTLGNFVFIGSNTTLVAPVELADYSFTAAGSCITSDVEKNSLAVGRARQKNISNWKRPDQRGEK